MDKDSLKIDLHRLEEEWITQPQLYEYYAEALAGEMRQRDEAKTNLETTLAETSLRIRDEALKEGTKVTEGIIREKTESDKHVIRAKKLLNTFNCSFQRAKGDLGAVDTKKKALEQEVSLYIGQYFSVPKEGHEAEGGKKGFEASATEKATAKQRKNLGKFSEPITDHDTDTRSEKEKFDEMSPDLKKKMLESTGKTEEEITGEEPKKKILRRKKT